MSLRSVRQILSSLILTLSVSSCYLRCHVQLEKWRAGSKSLLPILHVSFAEAYSQRTRRLLRKGCKIGGIGVDQSTRKHTNPYTFDSTARGVEAALDPQQMF